METQFEELQSALSQQIKESHNHSIQFVVLQDSESHHWQDPKAFFEVQFIQLTTHLYQKMSPLPSFPMPVSHLCP